MRIKAPFRIESDSKVVKVFGRQCRRIFWLRNSQRRTLQLIYWRPDGWKAGLGYVYKQVESYKRQP